MDELASQPGTATELAGKPARLTRLIDTLRRRDWLGIGIELVVVTLGILLAFQIDQWGDQRKQAREERQFLVRLDREYSRAIDELRTTIQLQGKAIEEVRVIMAAKDNPRALERYSSTEIGCRAGRTLTTPFNDTAYQELLASGRISIISDPKIRLSIRDLAASQAYAASMNSLGRQLAIDVRPFLDRYYLLSIAPDGEVRCRGDWAALLADGDAVNALIRIYTVNRLTRDRRRMVLAQTEQVRAEIQCAIGRAACRR
jgi:hypothetical protein